MEQYSLITIMIVLGYAMVYMVANARIKHTGHAPIWKNEKHQTHAETIQNTGQGSHNNGSGTSHIPYKEPAVKKQHHLRAVHNGKGEDMQPVVGQANGKLHRIAGTHHAQHNTGQQPQGNTAIQGTHGRSKTDHKPGEKTNSR